jgi:hypothetical protein
MLRRLAKFLTGDGGSMLVRVQHNTLTACALYVRGFISRGTAAAVNPAALAGYSIVQPPSCGAAHLLMLATSPSSSTPCWGFAAGAVCLSLILAGLLIRLAGDDSP